MTKIDVVIPCYNSMHTITPVVEGIFRALPEQFTSKVILVNDCSPDDVWEQIQTLCSRYQNVTGINLSRNYGQQSARMAALSYVDGDYVVFMDDDGQHDPTYIKDLIAKLEDGYDIVYAAFEAKQQARWKTLGSSFHQLTAEWLEEKPKGISTSSFFVVRRYVVDALRKYPSPTPLIFGYLMKTTQNVASIPVPHRSRIQGRTGYTLKKLFDLWLNAVTSFSVVPLRFASYIGLFSAIVGMLALCYIVARKLLEPTIAAGYTSIVAVVLLFAGIILLMLGLIGEYIGRMFMAINCVPQYVVKNVIVSPANPTQQDAQ